ncbi:MAG: PH domain-containing protein [Candidatus Altiarchaeota archaeon]|nr:PH domain-containing protein [Candidatus Altiarchaeota archaeon]
MSTETLRTKYPLKKAKILKKTIQTLMFLVPVAPFLLVGFFVSDAAVKGIILGVLFMVLVLAALVYWYQSVYFEKYFYDLTGEGLIIQKGVFSTKQTIVPLNKIQDIYLDQDIFDRIFGLWDLHISSATTVSGFEAHIDGVSREDGMIMRNLLLGETVSKPSGEGIKAEVYKPSNRGILMILLGGIFGLIFVAIFFTWFLVILIPALILSLLDFTVIRYELRDEGVYIRKGFLTPKESLFLYRNIQDVEESYDILSRILQLRTLTVKTMTSLSAADARMLYLTPEDSKNIREEVLKRCRTSVEEKPATEETAVTEEVVEKPEDYVKSPYTNHFLKSFLYGLLIGSAGLGVVFIAAVPLILLGFFVNPGFFLALLVVALISASINLGLLSQTISHLLSYAYEISPHYVIIKKGILNVQRKQISYGKMQDIILAVSFPQFFAGLATLKFDTGSKEVVAKGQSRQYSTQMQFTSLSSPVESVPDLNLGDAVELRRKIADYMRISSSCIGDNPLVKKFPIEDVKPLKKTLWWAMLLLPIAALAVVLIPAGLEVKLLPVLFSLILLAVKYVYEYYYYKRYFYDVNDQVLVIKKGVFGFREITVPFTKIQDIFVDQDILDRILGLRDVYVSTVTQRSILNAHIDGVNTENAEKIAEILIKSVKRR